MGQVKEPLPVKLISGIIAGDVNSFDIAHKALGKKFGAIDYKSPIYDFNLTDYYQKEMGPNLKRQFLSFYKLIDPVKLAKIKLIANRAEKRFSKEGKRLMTIDPGYVTASKLVLATTKNYSHRIYLKNGIYAEVTLRFKGGTFNPLDWTYPDYKTDGYLETFNRIRKIYLEQVKGQ